MRALRFERFGEPSEVLTLADLESQELPPGHARIRLALRPINPADLLTIRGHYGALPDLPATPGREGVGTIVELRGASAGLKVGDRVVVLDRIGTWQEEIVVEPPRLVAVPTQLSDGAAAQAFLNPLSAWAMLDELEVNGDEWLLQSAAASALGKLVIQMAAARGVRTINIVRRPEQAEQLRMLGADEVLVWPASGRRLADLVREITGGDVRYALDAVGGELGGEMVNCLAAGGVMLVHGSLAHPETMPISSGRFLTRSLTLRGFWLNEWLARTSLDEQREALRLVLEQMAAGELRAPDVEATYDLAAFQEAIAHAERSRDGKIMLSG